MSHGLRYGVPVILVLVCGASARGGEVIDPAKGVAGAEGAVLWFDALLLGVENQGWSDVAAPYDRLPKTAEGVVPGAVWSLSRHSAGLCVRFVTDSSEIHARWSLTSGNLEMNHMPATGVSGLDLYVKRDGAWGWVAVGRPEKQEANESVLVKGAPEGAHEYMLYLPLYNGTAKLEIGLVPTARLEQAPPYPAERAKPILFWGTSILQGGCASRPGMAYPSIIGRRMQRPTINLGFSGNGKMDPEITALIAQRDVAAYVIDCLPNMKDDLVAERVEPLVHTLRAAKPDVPIILVESIEPQAAWFIPATEQAYKSKNALLRSIYERLQAEGVGHLHYIPCDDLFGHDHEATVDGVHATDLGFLRMADAIEPYLRAALGQP